MLRPLRCSSLALGAALLLTTACLSERGGTPQPAAAAAARAKPRAAPSGPVADGGECESAALTLAPGTVVGRVRGEDVKVEDLGEELTGAEKQALRSYCKAVTESRNMAFDNFVHKKLLEELAKAEGKSLQDYLQGRVEAEVPEPDETAVQAFYDANKSDQTPPLELVRDQVVQAMKSEGTDAALEKIIGDIEAKNGVERLLADVAMAPADLSNPPHAPVIGPADAAVQVAMFSDFECPYCSRAAKDKYAGASVQFVYRHFPLPSHPNARPAAEYAQCAQAQGKFWPMHDAIFAAQRELSPEKLKELAAQAGVEAAGLEACLATEMPGKEVTEDLNKGREAGVEGTPSFYINGRAFAGNPTFEGIGKAIDEELGKAKKG
jgi:protein-disulfide isomerase